MAAGSFDITDDEKRYRYVVARPIPDVKIKGTCKMLWVVDSPSETLTDGVSDATTRRILGHSKRYCATQVRIVYLYAYPREDTPWAMPDQEELNGSDVENDKHIIEQAYWADQIILAWGDLRSRYPHLPGAEARAQKVLSMIKSVVSDKKCPIYRLESPLTTIPRVSETNFGAKKTEM